jgi:hypothetical protein
MSDNEPCESSNEAHPETSDLIEDAIKGDQERSTSYHKNGKQTASNSKRVTRGKNDPRYWWARIFKPVSGRGEISKHYAVKIQFRGRRVAFTLSTGNKDAASRRASKLYADIVARGLDAVIAERRSMFRKIDDETMAIRSCAAVRANQSCHAIEKRLVRETCVAAIDRSIGDERALGLTRDGKKSAHTLDNTGPRMYLVIEHDKGTVDEQAAIAFHLAEFALLALAVHSGSKGLHAWFACAGARRSDDRTLHALRRAHRAGTTSLMSTPEGWQLAEAERRSYPIYRSQPF